MGTASQILGLPPYLCPRPTNSGVPTTPLQAQLFVRMTPRAQKVFYLPFLICHKGYNSAWWKRRIGQGIRGLLPCSLQACHPTSTSMWAALGVLWRFHHGDVMVSETNLWYFSPPQRWGRTRTENFYPLIMACYFWCTAPIRSLELVILLAYKDTAWEMSRGLGVLFQEPDKDQVFFYYTVGCVSLVRCVEGMERFDLVSKAPLDSAILFSGWALHNVASLRTGCLLELQGCLGLTCVFTAWYITWMALISPITSQLLPCLILFHLILISLCASCFVECQICILNLILKMSFHLHYKTSTSVCIFGLFLATLICSFRGE